MDSLCVFPAYYRERETTAMSKKGKKGEPKTDTVGKTESKLKRFLNNSWFVSISCSLIVYFAIQLPMEANFTKAMDKYFADNNLIVSVRTDNIEANPEMNNINSSGNTQTNANASNGGTLISEAGPTTINNYNFYYNYSKNDALKKMARSYLLSVDENGEAVEVGSGATLGETDTAIEELRNQRVLMVNEWAGAEYYFLGQFDNSGQWDGNCILNVYMDGILRVITEGQFVSGVMVSRLQVYNQNSGGWVLSDRTVEADGSLSGESWSYPYLLYPQGFVTEEVTDHDIKTYGDFERWLEKEGLVYNKYYSGNVSYSDSVSGITYNDDTGKAYYAIYFDNGEIRTLYVGQFRDGKFEDERYENDMGKAFWISKQTPAQTAYVYFKGRFLAGEPVEEDLRQSENVIWAMPQEQIDKKLADAEAIVGNPLQCRLDGLLMDI